MFFSKGFNYLVIFVFISIIVDTLFYLTNNKNKTYSKFELQSGSYVDILFLYLIILFVCKYTINLNNNIITLTLGNLILALLYCGSYKCFLQIIIKTGYSWVDTKKEIKDMKRINWTRFTLFFNYITIIALFRIFLMSKKISLFLVILLILFTRKASKRCSKIYYKIKQGESNDSI